MSETPLETAHRIAREYGHDINDDIAGYVVWNETGYPGFFMGDPHEEFERQLREFFESASFSSEAGS